MPDSPMDEALRRYRIIRPFLEEGVPLSVIATRQQMTARALRLWVRRYRSQGMAGLARQRRSDKGASRVLSSALRDLTEALALETPRTATAVWRTVTAMSREQKGNKGGNGQKQDRPSYQTVRRIIRSIDPALRSLAHEGKKAYGERYDLLYRREAAAPNAIWQADHTLLDLLVLDEQGKTARPWLTVIIDDYSRAIAGYYLSFHPPSALQTALALRQAIWRKAEPLWQVCGIPEVLYTDHGRDFTSRHLEQVCADLKVRAVFSQVGQPRGRGRIERFFRTINQRLLSTLPGFLPASGPGGGRRTLPAASLTLAALDTAFRRFLLEDYHRTPHSATGIAPQERWHGKGFLPRLPESLEQLDLLLLTVAQPRKVQADGIRFHGFRYLDPLLAAYVGETVTIRYDPRDLGEIRVYYRDAFLGRAVCQELAGATVSFSEIRGARLKRTRELQQVIRERHRLLDITFPQPHEVSPQEPPPHRPRGKKAAPASHLKRYRCDR